MSIIALRTTELYIHGDSTDEALLNLTAVDHKHLAMQALNDHLNNFVRRQNSRAEGAEGLGDSTFPYMGWFWRDVNWLTPGNFTIAGDGEVRVCQNNKWGIPGRKLTGDELAVVRGHVWDAYMASCAGGVLDEIHDAVDGHLSLAATFIANLDVQEAPDAE